MSDKQISAVAPVWGGLGSGNAEQKYVECFNTSGGTLAHGDVVVVDTSATQMPTAPGSCTGAVKTTVTALDVTVVGVVSVDGTPNTNAGTIPVNGACLVCISGVARVNIGANTVAAGAALGTTTTAKQAGSVTATIGATLGFALEAQTAKDANNTIRALVKCC